jgi:hypothetical protein
MWPGALLLSHDNAVGESADAGTGWVMSHSRSQLVSACVQREKGVGVGEWWDEIHVEW